MLQSKADLRGEDRFPDVVLEDARNGALWALWAHDAAEEALQWPVNELAAELVARPAYAARIREIFKMLLVERVNARFRARVAEEVVAHVRAALVQGGLDASEQLLDTPIEFGVVPPFIGVEPGEAHCLRPRVERGS